MFPSYTVPIRNPPPKKERRSPVPQGFGAISSAFSDLPFFNFEHTPGFRITQMGESPGRPRVAGREFCAVEFSASPPCLNRSEMGIIVSPFALQATV